MSTLISLEQAVDKINEELDLTLIYNEEHNFAMEEDSDYMENMLLNINFKEDDTFEIFMYEVDEEYGPTGIIHNNISIDNDSIEKAIEILEKLRNNKFISSYGKIDIHNGKIVVNDLIMIKSLKYYDRSLMIKAHNIIKENRKTFEKCKYIEAIEYKNKELVMLCYGDKSYKLIIRKDNSGLIEISQQEAEKYIVKAVNII